MLLLIIFAFLGGIVTILSPCILPILPILLSSGVTGSKKKPLGIVTGFIASFTFFTLFLSTIVQALNIPPDALRNFSILVIFLFGVSLVIPKVQAMLEIWFAKFSSKLPVSKSTDSSFVSGVVVGLSLGLLWTPCVGPILASVITLALTGTVTSAAAIITFAYALGTAIPMLIITYTGRSIFQKVPSLLANTSKIQQVFGVIMIATAVAMFMNLDRQFQTFILQTFPNYGTGLTRIEDNALIQNALDVFQNPDQNESLDTPNEVIPAPELIQGGLWFNSEPLQLSELRGKVVLIDFWTYSCINCIRTLPYLQDWHEKYQDDGLVIIGVHAPEFEFEKDANNVMEAITDFGLTYPVMQDNDFQTWRAYQNRYWPAKYLIDKDGNVRYWHFGEGKYDETEEFIQQLLAETGQTPTEEINNPEYQVRTRTPELYLGNLRIEALSSPENITPYQSQNFTIPASLPLHSFAYSGQWTVNDEYSQASQNGVLELRFESQDVFLVMNPVNGAQTVQVLLDGQVISDDNAGTDAVGGSVEVNQERLYHIVDLEKPGKHSLRLVFPDGNVEVYAFTFG